MIPDKLAFADESWTQSVSYWKEETDKAWAAAHRWREEEAVKSGELVTQIKALGALLPVNTGGTMENDPCDAILAATIRLLSRS
jgi:hypothetical protein